MIKDYAWWVNIEFMLSRNILRLYAIYLRDIEQFMGLEAEFPLGMRQAIGDTVLGILCGLWSLLILNT